MRCGRAFKTFSDMVGVGEGGELDESQVCEKVNNMIEVANELGEL